MHGTRHFRCPAPSPAATFSPKPLLAANVACTMAMMSFVPLVGPIVRLLRLPPWQAGAAVTVGGVLWMLLSRPWGTASDRHGRRTVLLRNRPVKPRVLIAVATAAAQRRATLAMR